jgi:hypothetical protein
LFTERAPLFFLLGNNNWTLFCVAGTFVSFLIMAMSIDNYYVVLGSRILDGILGGNVSLAQAYVSGLRLIPSHTVNDFR